MNGTDSYGFRALPAGIDSGDYTWISTYRGDYSVWWTGTELDATGALTTTIDSYEANVGGHDDKKTDGSSLRCIHD